MTFRECKEKSIFPICLQWFPFLIERETFHDLITDEHCPFCLQDGGGSGLDNTWSKTRDESVSSWFYNSAGWADRK